MDNKYTYFTNLCKMTQSTLKLHCYNQLSKTHSEVVFKDGFVFAQGTFPVLLVAHLDTVHKNTPKNIIYAEHSDTISSPQGIGGDDRCGVYMIFEVLKQFNCSVLFCEDEEIGGAGAEKFIDHPLASTLSFNYIIEFDRKGKNDAVFYNCANDKFEDFITKEFYKTAFGTFSDISFIAPFLGCAAVNLSCGYYNAHTLQEYVIFSEMEASIKAACDILARTTENDVFEYIRGKATTYDDWYDDDKWYMEEQLYIIEYDNKTGLNDFYCAYATSEYEAIGKFVVNNPTRCFDDIISVDTEDEKYM